MATNIQDQQPIIKNYPYKVEYSGLVGTTMTMQKAGWQLAVETEMSYRTHGYSVRLLGKHPTQQMQFISYPFELSMRDLMNDRLHYMFDGLPPIQMHVISREIMMNVPMGKPMGVCGAVDFSRPILEGLDRKSFGLDECVAFKTFNEDATLYVPEKEIWTMEKHLEAIVAEQKPFQAELREKQRRKERSMGCREGEELSKGLFTGEESQQQVKLQLVAV